MNTAMKRICLAIVLLASLQAQTPAPRHRPRCANDQPRECRLAWRRTSTGPGHAGRPHCSAKSV